MSDDCEVEMELNGSCGGFEIKIHMLYLADFPPTRGALAEPWMKLRQVHVPAGDGTHQQTNHTQSSLLLLPALPYCLASMRVTFECIRYQYILL